MNSQPIATTPPSFCQAAGPEVEQAAPDGRLPRPGGCTLTHLLEGRGVAAHRGSHQGLLLQDGSDRGHQEDEEKSQRSWGKKGREISKSSAYSQS